MDPHYFDILNSTNQLDLLSPTQKRNCGGKTVIENEPPVEKVKECFQNVNITEWAINAHWRWNIFTNMIAGSTLI